MRYVYALCDPKTGERRYIGQTADPNKRLSEHLKDARNGTKTYKANWLRSLSGSPKLEILEESSSASEINDLEISWIDRLFDQETKITNGRRGAFGGSPGLEARRKISRKLKGRTSPNKGNRYSEETRKKISRATSGNRNPFYGKKHTEKSLRLIRMARRKQGTPSMDYRKQGRFISQMNLARKQVCQELSLSYHTKGLALLIRERMKEIGG